jgi:hypothetical protein
MQTRLAVLVAVLVIGFTSAPSGRADSFGLIPAMSGKEKLTQKQIRNRAAEDRGVGTMAAPVTVKRGVPSTIVGLEGYSLFGTDAGAAGVLTGKKRVGQWNDVQFNAGALVGVAAPEADGSNALIFGGVLEAEALKFGGLVLVVRGDGGWRVNPGFKLNVVGWSF